MQTPQFPATGVSSYMGITDEYLVTGFVANTGAGDYFSGAGAVNLHQLPAN